MAAVSGQWSVVRRTTVGIGLSVLGLVADRMLKWFATHSLPPEGVLLVPGVLRLERFANAGIAFSLPLARSAILVATVVIVVAIVRQVWTHDRTPRGIAALALILLGAASNFFDRLAYGFVVDYLRVGPWSLVNLADGMIVAGLLLALIRPKGREETKAAG